MTTMTSIKTLLAAALVAGSAGLAFASDNGDGARELAELRAVQQQAPIASSDAATAGEYNYGDSNVERPMPQFNRRSDVRNTEARPAAIQSFEYRGNAD
jgi:hypothetical protein